MKAFECEADRIYVVTLSSKLSGSYNSAVLGKNLYEEEYSDKQIVVLDSKSASVGQTLIAMKIVEAEDTGLSLKKLLQRQNSSVKKNTPILYWNHLKHCVRTAD